jgi:hypothetical protein
MKHLLSRLVALSALLLLSVHPSAAQTGAFTYQGRLTVNGGDFTGTGRFKFALVTSTTAAGQATATAYVTNGFIFGYTLTSGGAGYTNAPKVTIVDATGSGAMATAQIGTNGLVNNIVPLAAGSGYSANPTVIIDPPGGQETLLTRWSHDGTSIAGSEPTTAISLPVSGGLFTITLGDPTTPGMQAIAAGLFSTPGLRLRIWFDDGVNGFAALSPAQPLMPTPYASRARSVSWTNLTELPVGSENAAYRAGAGLSLSNNTVAIATNAITSEMLATNAVTSFAIANGTIAREDLGPTVLNASFWSLTGNTAVTDTNNPASTNTFVGTIDNRPLNFQVNGQRALRLEPANGSAPNFIGGFAGNTAGSGTVGVVVAGGGAAVYDGAAFTNRVDSDFGVVGGGLRNAVSTNALAATIGGGALNRVGGGAEYATIAAGRLNNVLEGSAYAAIGGGYQNTVQTTSSHAVIAGGQFNTVGNDSGSSTLSGGRANVVLPGSPYAVIAGGYLNTNGAPSASVPGGTLNAALGANSLAAGRRAKALHAGSFVWGDGFDADVASSTTNQFTVRAIGGARFFSNGGLTAGVTLATGATSWSTLSDEAMKKNRVAADGREILEKLAAIPVDHWNYLWEDDASTPHLGPMAQDFKRAFFPGRDDKTISTAESEGVALAAIQGLNQKLEEQAATLQAKDAELRSLRAEMEQLRRLVQDAVPQKP